MLVDSAQWMTTGYDLVGQMDVVQHIRDLDSDPFRDGTKHFLNIIATMALKIEGQEEKYGALKVKVDMMASELAEMQDRLNVATLEHYGIFAVGS